MINYCSYRYNPITQGIENAVFSLAPRVLIPFDNRTKKGWCEFHRRWELITIAPDGSMFYSCGLRVPSTIGLNRNWNKNQYELIVDTDSFIIRVNERWNWIDVYDNQIYSTDRVLSKIIDFDRGIISHPRGFNITEMSPEINQKLMAVMLKLCNQRYGVNFHVENAGFKDFVRYPCCPEFNKIAPKVDNVKNFNFRADMNLFKDFCMLVQLKETKSLRKDFHKNPELILLHALAQYLGFVNSDAIKTFVSSKDLFRIFVTDGCARFSIRKRSIYLNNNIGPTVLDGLRLWVQNARTDKSEAVVVKRLIKFLKDTNMDLVNDAADVYYRNARNLPVAFHERILKEGFTQQMHDQLVVVFGDEDDDDRYGYSSSEEKVKNKTVEYEKEVALFEDFIEGVRDEDIKIDYESIKQNRLMMLKAEKAQKKNIAKADEEELVPDDAEDALDDTPEEVEDLFIYEKLEKEVGLPKVDFKIGKDIMKKGDEQSYFFALPRDTDELYEISTHMRNCVGYLYRERVVSQKCIIVVLIHRNKMKACMEIRLDHSTFHYNIVQAAGPGNANINRKYSIPIEAWKKKHNIGGEITYKL